jgi:hypothetical protein
MHLKLNEHWNDAHYAYASFPFIKFITKQSTTIVVKGLIAPNASDNEFFRLCCANK